jgi:WD40 repeat protein
VISADLFEHSSHLYPISKLWFIVDCDVIRFATTCAGQPVHLWDAYTGKLRASMKGLDQYYEMISAYSITIDAACQNLIAGYSKMFKVFDIERPEREISHFNTCGTYSKSKRIKRVFNVYLTFDWTIDRQNGQTGHISCLTVNPANQSIIGVGSFGRQIGLYSLTDHEQICVLLGQNAGLTHLQFSGDGSRLYSAGRKSEELLCWDMRHLGQILFSMKRPASTNQRLLFALNASSKYLVSGDQNGFVHWWDVKQFESGAQFSCLEPSVSVKLEDDCLNGVGIHPSLPILATSSGQRQFRQLLLTDDQDDDETLFSEKPDGNNFVRLWWTTDVDEFNQLYCQQS